MRALLQRVKAAHVRVGAREIGRIGPGWLVLLGVGREDSGAQAQALAEQIVHIRAFADDAGKMNRSALDIGAEILVVSQFTLYADLRRGRRPYFGEAAPPDIASALVDAFTAAVASYGLRTASGEFTTIWLPLPQLPPKPRNSEG